MYLIEDIFLNFFFKIKIYLLIKLDGVMMLDLMLI